MKRRILAPLFFGLLAVLFAASAVYLAVQYRNADPVLLAAPEAAVQRAEDVMDALCDGDFLRAQTMLYGNPDLGVDREPADPVGAVLWDAYVDSLTYELVGPCYAADTGLVQQVKITGLELSSATEYLGPRARALLNEALEQAEDVSEIYDENNEYREDLVAEVMAEAARQALEADVRYSYRIVTLQLVYDDGQWWVAADEGLLGAISGTGEQERKK